MTELFYVATDFLPCRAWILRATIMKALFTLVALTLMASVPAYAGLPKVAVFDFELVDTSLQGEVDGPRT